MTAPSRRALTNAAPLAVRHPLGTREKRTPLNYALRAKGVPAKACSMCWVVKSTSQFNKKGSASDGLDANCRTCSSALHASRKKNDPDYSSRHRKLARESARRLYPSKRELISQQTKTRRAGYVANNASRVQDPNVLRRCTGQCGLVLPETEFRLDRGARDGLRHRCNRCSDAWRRARRACLQAYGEPVGQDCYLCGSQITVKSEGWVDHLIPQSQAGPDTADNVRWSHSICNIRRGADPLTADQVKRALAFGPVPSLISGDTL